MRIEEPVRNDTSVHEFTAYGFTSKGYMVKLFYLLMNVQATSLNTVCYDN